MNRHISVILCFFLLVACNEKAEEVKTEGPVNLPPQYYYFPKANVYVDSANKDYIFLGGDGQSWQTAKQIPVAMQTLMDKNVLIENPAQPVWKDNENHRLVYSALLYATASDTLTKAPPKPVIMPSKPVSDTATEPEKERKGLRKFFDKIFGKSKKEKQTGEEEEQQKDQ